jgi:hypothetical protein
MRGKAELGRYATEKGELEARCRRQLYRSTYMVLSWPCCKLGTGNHQARFFPPKSKPSPTKCTLPLPRLVRFITEFLSVAWAGAF